MKDLGYGVIGCGGVSTRHLDVVEQSEGMRLVAVADREVERAQRAGESRASRPAAHQDYHDLLARPDVAVVVICVPSQFHAEVAVAAANAGKHVYCEKVMATSVNEARAMIHAAAANRVKLMIGHNTRYFPVYAQAHRLIRAGEIGDVLGVDGAFPTPAFLPGAIRPTFWRCRAGARGHGDVMNSGCHQVDTARYLCGSEFVRVSSVITNRFSEERAPEDQYVITAMTESGAVVTIAQYGQLSYIPARNSGFTVYGTRGTLEAYRPGTVALRRAGDADYTVVEPDPDLADGNPWKRFHREFRAAIEEDTDPSVTGTDGLRNLEWALGAYIANENRAWVNLPLAPEHWGYAGPILEEDLAPARDAGAGA